MKTKLLINYLCSTKILGAEDDKDIRDLHGYSVYGVARVISGGHPH
jgi:hypothetical protein